MPAEMVAQRGVQQVRRAVVGAQRVATLDIDREMHGIADFDRSGFDAGLVRVQAAERLGRIVDHRLQPAERGDDPGVAHLAAALAIKGCLVDQDGDGLSRRGAVDLGPVADQRDDLGLAFGRGIAGKLGAAGAFGNVVPNLGRCGLARTFPGSACGCLLRGHRGVETFAIDAEAAAAQRVFGQVIGEAIGVVEAERGFARKHRAFGEICGGLVEQPQPLVERLAEAGFLALQCLFDQRLRAQELGEGLAHFGDERGHQTVHQRIGGAQDMRMAHRAAHDPAQHIAAAFIGGEHTIGDEERGGAKMIGDDAMARLVVAGGRGAGRLARGGDQRLEQVDIVIVVHALHDGGDALDAHAGVDRRPRQVGAAAIGMLFILHEHQVPDLDEPVAVLVRRSRRAAENVIAMVVEDLAARAARPGIAHRPEIVRGGDADDALVGQPGDLLPQPERLVIGMIDGDGQPIGGQAPGLVDQRPGVVDRLFLEIVAEREIAQHLEKGVVPRGIADIVEIVVLAPGADAFLRRGGARIGAGLEPGEHVLERHHAGVDEHQRRVVVRDQRRGGNDVMAVAPEIFEERAPDVICRCHGCDIRRVEARLKQYMRKNEGTEPLAAALPPRSYIR